MKRMIRKDGSFNSDFYMELKDCRREKQLPIIGEGLSPERTVDKVPNNKIFDFLRNAFAECPFKKGMVFHKKSNPGVKYHVEQVYWDWFCGYTLNILYHTHYNPNNYEDRSHGVAWVKDVNTGDQEIIDQCNKFLENIIIDQETTYDDFISHPHVTEIPIIKNVY